MEEKLVCEIQNNAWRRTANNILSVSSQSESKIKHYPLVSHTLMSFIRLICFNCLCNSRLSCYKMTFNTLIYCGQTALQQIKWTLYFHRFKLADALYSLKIKELNSTGWKPKSRGFAVVEFFNVK